MTSAEFGQSVHPREYPRLVLASIFAIVAILTLLSLIFMSSGLVLAIFLGLAFLVWFGFEIFYATFLSNWILVSEHNYPRLNELLQEMKEEIGVKKNIDIIVFGQGVFNAYFSMLFARRAIFIDSELLADGVTDDELRWLIGRFVGRIRAKQRMGILGQMIAFTERLLIFNFFIFPYERATAYTGDRVALAAVKGDLSPAISAMNKLMVGRELGYSVNPAGVVRQYRRVKGSFFAFLARLASPLPHNTARYVDLIAHAEKRFPEQYEQFAAMNPSFQVAGGTWPLLRSTEKRGDGFPSLVGWMLLLGAIILGAVSGVALATRGPFFGFMRGSPLAGLPSPSQSNPFDPSLGGMSGDIGSLPPPVVETAAYDLNLLSADVRSAAVQARDARARAESVAADARTAAQQGQLAGANNPQEGLGYYNGVGDSLGDNYQGYFSKGLFNGFGVYTYGTNKQNSDGALKYEGEFAADRFEGYGVLSWTNGASYLGQQAAGRYSGAGVLTYTDGARYEGQWTDGMRSGYGVVWTADGKIESAGLWTNDVLTTPTAP